MNKFAAAGLMQAAHDGARIIVLTTDSRKNDDVLAELAEQLPQVPLRVLRGSGRAGIRFPDGNTIDVCSWRLADRRVRGRTFDVVYLEPDVDAQMGSSGLVFSLFASLDAATPGELVRA